MGKNRKRNNYEIQKKRNLFSLYEKGIRISDEMNYSITKEKIALKVANIAKAKKFQHIVDGCSGAGGNAIAFARAGLDTTAIEFDLDNFDDSIHNANIYGVAEIIDFKCCDLLKYMPPEEFQKERTLLHASPEWGGPSYQKLPVFDVNATNPPVNKILAYAASTGYTETCLYLPRTSDISMLEEMGCYEVMYMYHGGWCNAICAWFRHK